MCEEGKVAHMQTQPCMHEERPLAVLLMHARYNVCVCARVRTHTRASDSATVQPINAPRIAPITAPTVAPVPIHLALRRMLSPCAASCQ